MSTLVDTNVLSEMLRADPRASVVAWFSQQRPDSLYTSVVTQAEMQYGVRIMPTGRRRSALDNAVAAMFSEEFAGRVLPFDSDAVPAYVDIVATRRAIGRPISQFDAQIAAIARIRRMAIATRDAAGFDGCGVAVIDPWAFGRP